MALPSVQHSPDMSQSVRDARYLPEQQAGSFLQGTHFMPGFAGDEKIYDHFHQKQSAVHSIMPPCGAAQTIGNDPAGVSPSGFIITQNSQSFGGSIPPDNPHVQPPVQHGTGFSQTQFCHMPSPPPPPPPPPPPTHYTYRSSEISHRSSTSFEKDHCLPHVKNAQGEQRHMPRTRTRFDDVQYGHDGWMQAQGTGFMIADGQLTLEGENLHQKKYPPCDFRGRPNNGNTRPTPGLPYACGPVVQVQGISKTVTGTPAKSSMSNLEMSNSSSYAGHVGGMPGGLLLGVTDQTQVPMLTCRPGGPTSKWRPN